VGSWAAFFCNAGSQ